jgi:hypothetical protein
MDWQKGLYIFKIYIPAAMTNSIPRNTIWPTEFLETPLLHYSITPTVPTISLESI